MFDEEDLAEIRSERDRWTGATLSAFLGDGERKEEGVTGAHHGVVRL
jgi:hypothetical protein